MSFQFFSKLDNKFTDGPVSPLDPNNTRAKQKIAQSGGDMGKAIQYDLRNMRDNKRMARRAYRTAMRSGNINELAAAANMVSNAGGRFMGPGETERRVDLELERRTTTGEIGRSRLDHQPGLGSGQATQGGVTDMQSGFAESQSFESNDPFNDPRVATKNVPFAQRQREAFRSDLHKSDLLKPETPLADREMAKARAYKRADQLGIDRAKVDKEMGWDKQKVAASDADAMNSGLAESERVSARNRHLDSVRESRTEPNPALDAAMSRLEEISNRTKESGDVREKAALERRAEFDARGKEIEAEKAASIAAAEGRYESALGGLENRAKVREEQAKVQDDYFAAAELQDSTLQSAEANALARGLPFKNAITKTYDYPFKPHGIDSGSLKAESSDALQYKKAIERGRAFNAALGGEDVTVRYHESTGGVRRGKTFNSGKFKSIFGDKSVSFQNDAFRPLKDAALKPVSSGRGGSPHEPLRAMDKIIKAAVDNKYPIELDEELMAVPQFRQKLTDARVKSGMKTDKITGYTSFSFD